MGRFYSLKIPSNIEGVSTTVDIGMGPINHIAFNGGMSRNKIYEVMANGSFGDSVVNLITDDMNEFVSVVRDGLGTTIIPYEVRTVEKAVETLRSMESRVSQRYDLLRRVNQKNIECYNNWAGEQDKMKPVVICWIGADKVLKQISHEDVYNLLVYFLKVGRAVGVTLLLHSDDLDGIQETLGTDMFKQFTLIHVPEDNTIGSVTVCFASNKYHADTVTEYTMQNV